MCCRRIGLWPSHAYQHPSGNLLRQVGWQGRWNGVGGSSNEVGRAELVSIRKEKGRTEKQWKHGKGRSGLEMDRLVAATNPKYQPHSQLQTHGVVS